MNLIFNFRTIVTMLLITGGIVVPRILMYFGLTGQFMTDWTSAAATFVILLLAFGIFSWQWLRNRRLMLPIITLIFIAAFAITHYFCGLPLPW